MVRLSLSLSLLCVGLLIGAPAHTKSFQLTASPAVPAASGKVDAKKNKNGNTDVTITAKHLAQPGMLTPAAASYVVWFREDGGQPMNEGQFKVGKDLKADYKTTTRLRSFDVILTAESDPNASVPSSQVVLSTKVQA